jgi:hypothetical protein
MSIPNPIEPWALKRPGWIDYRRWSMVVDRASAEVWASWFRALDDASRVLILNRLGSHATRQAVVTLPLTLI